MKKLFFFFLPFLIVLTSCGDFQDVTFSGIEGVKIVKMSQQGIEAEIIAKIKNPNKMAFTVYPTDMDVTLSGMSAGKAHLSSRVRIKPHSEELYTFKIKSDFSSVNLMDLPKLLGMAMSKNAKVGLKGDLKVGKLFVKRSYPVDVSERVPLNTN